MSGSHDGYDEADPKPDRPGQAVEYHGDVDLRYRPQADHEPDPGEVVWTWVPYEEDPDVGKDRPVVVVGALRPGPDAEGRSLALLMLSTQDHDGDPDWVPIGTGDWDAEHRESSARVDRVFAVAADGVRREGGTLGERHFMELARALHERYGWT